MQRHQRLFSRLHSVHSDITFLYLQGHGSASAAANRAAATASSRQGAAAKVSKAA